MARFRVSLEAEDDLDRIVDYTSQTWGKRQAERYLTKLEDCFQMLAESPSVGRSVDSILKGLRRFEVGSHVVFYLADQNETLVLRILHRQMLPTRHFD